MKSRYFVISLCVVFFASYIAVISYALGPENIFHAGGIVHYPSVIMQLLTNEGNGIICVDACGPCSAWGHNYVLVGDQCKIPDGVEDCYFIDPPMEWTFVNDRCIPTDGYGEQQ